MRELKRRDVLPGGLTTRQLIVLELMLMANIALVAAAAVIGLSEGWFGPFAHGRRAGAPALGAASTQVFKVAGPTTTGTPSPAATGPQPSATPTFGVTATAGLHPSNTPTPASAGLLAAGAPTDVPTSGAQTPTPIDVRGHPQSLPLSCEARSAADWAAYFGVPIDELDFFARLPTSDNPDAGFVGDVNGRWGQIPPEPYGVHAGPVAALLRDYGLRAEAHRGLGWEEVRAEIDARRPVIAWVVGHVSRRSLPVEYTASDGHTTVVAPYEHTVIVVGYTQDEVTVVDGARVYARPLDTFLISWSVLGNMAILAGP